MEAVKKKRHRPGNKAIIFTCMLLCLYFFVSTAAFILMLCHYQLSLELVSYFDALILCNLAT